MIITFLNRILTVNNLGYNDLFITIIILTFCGFMLLMIEEQ